MKQLIECVPNFSEGNDPAVIRQITDRIAAVAGVRLLNVDPGKATNRTVVTFVGTPEAVVAAAFGAIQIAGELIDMRKHTGEHPRMGATDVCPFVPVSGITMEETAAHARKLAEKVGSELRIPVYLYEAAQPDKRRSNLSVIRAGEYEGFEKKILLPEWRPDFGPAEFDARRGATVIGAREFLVALNVNLNTTSTRRANAIAFDVREAGRTRTDAQGNALRDAHGNPLVTPGSLKSVKAIGWFIKEYGVAQISMNLTNTAVTPVHIAFDEVAKKAAERGLRATGSELVGVIPRHCLVDAGKYFLEKQQRSTGVPESELVKIAVKSMGLDELAPFNPAERVIEYLLRDAAETQLVALTLADFADETSSESMAPGGGSIAAYMGVLGVALGTMVANLSAHKRGWDARWKEFSDWAAKGQQHKDALLRLVDEDTAAFNKIVAALALPKATAAEQAARAAAVQAATKYAAEVPLLVMQTALASMELIEAMVMHGNPNSITDAGVGALAARAAVMGAFMNVRANARSLTDRTFAADIIAQGRAIQAQAIAIEQSIVALVDSKID
ncbi:MAG: glutamate formimidoyltransferase [Chloroflexi bacterium]|nr:MAG: glutamate formimidoyltransferase [Chloroflexota bacterium]